MEGTGMERKGGDRTGEDWRGRERKGFNMDLKHKFFDKNGKKITAEERYLLFNAHSDYKYILKKSIGEVDICILWVGIDFNCYNEFTDKLRIIKTTAVRKNEIVLNKFYGNENEALADYELMIEKLGLMEEKTVSIA
ncbi:MAG: hypothetical protein ACE5RC_00030 [Nitrosopumilus sp.]